LSEENYSAASAESFLSTSSFTEELLTFVLDKAKKKRVAQKFVTVKWPIANRLDPRFLSVTYSNWTLLMLYK